MTLFERVKELAKSRGLSLQVLSEKAGMSANTLYTWKDVTPTVENVLAVADALNVSIDTLMDRDNAHDRKSNKVIEVKELFSDDELLMSFEGKQISKSYREAVIAMLRGMPDPEDK